MRYAIAFGTGSEAAASQRLQVVCVCVGGGSPRHLKKNKQTTKIKKKNPTVPTPALRLFEKINYLEFFLPVRVIFPMQSQMA